MSRAWANNTSTGRQDCVINRRYITVNGSPYSTQRQRRSKWLSRDTEISQNFGSDLERSRRQAFPRRGGGAGEVCGPIADLGSTRRNQPRSVENCAALLDGALNRADTLRHLPLDPLHCRHTSPAQPRGLDDASAFPKLGADLLGLVPRQRRLADRIAALGPV
jgi:hypothetical protein